MYGPLSTFGLQNKRSDLKLFLQIGCVSDLDSSRSLMNLMRSVMVLINSKTAFETEDIYLSRIKFKEG